MKTTSIKSQELVTKLNIAIEGATFLRNVTLVRNINYDKKF